MLARSPSGSARFDGSRPEDMQSDIYNIATDVSRSVKLSCTPVCLADLPDWLVSPSKDLPHSKYSLGERSAARNCSTTITTSMPGISRLCHRWRWFALLPSNFWIPVRRKGKRSMQKYFWGLRGCRCHWAQGPWVLIRLINATGAVMLEYYVFVVT